MGCALGTAGIPAHWTEPFHDTIRSHVKDMAQVRISEMAARLTTAALQTRAARGEDMVDRIIIGNDHGGFDAKTELARHLRERGIEVVDAGCASAEIVRYPHYARTVAGAVARGEFERGILICSTGIGMSIAATSSPACARRSAPAPIWPR